MQLSSKVGLAMEWRDGKMDVSFHELEVDKLLLRRMRRNFSLLDGRFLVDM